LKRLVENQMSEQPNQYSSILLFSRSQYRGIQIRLARELKARYGSKIVLACANKDHAVYYGSFKDCFDHIVSMDFFYSSLDDPVTDTDDLLRRALRLESEYDWKLTHLMGDDRHVGLGFSPGGINLARSRYAEKATYWKTLRMFVLMYEFVEKLLEENSISLVLWGNFVASVICEKRRLPYFILNTSGYRNYFYWSPNYLLEAPWTEQRYSELDQGSEHELEQPPNYYVHNRTLLVKRFGFQGFLRGAGYELARRAWQTLKRYEKIKGYKLSGKVCERWSIYRQFKTLSREKLWSLKELEGKPYVVFPLGSEPERVLTGRSPEMTDQFFAALIVAKNLPAGTFLVVKEHLSALGNRPKDFYKQLRLIPNLLFLDPLESGLSAINGAKCVVNVTGTSGIEATVLGVPVITFCKRNPFNVVEHVHPVSDWNKIPETVSMVMSYGQDTRPERIRNGKKYLRALVETSVDLGELKIQAEPDEQAMDKLLENLDQWYRFCFSEKDNNVQ